MSGLHGLSQADRDRVAAALASAQARTRARFALVIVPASDRYHLYPVVWAASLALLAFGIIAAAYPHLPTRFVFFVVAALFVVVSFVLEWRPLRMLAVPRRTKHAHARVMAHREFAARILSHPGHEGVLFFVSLAERYAEVVADRVLHEATGQAAWDGIMREFTEAARAGRIADGFVAGAQACGALLERHHPKT